MKWMNNTLQVWIRMACNRSIWNLNCPNLGVWCSDPHFTLKVGCDRLIETVTWFDKTILRGGTLSPDESVLFFELSSSSSEWSRLGAFFGLFVTDKGLFRSAATRARALAPPTFALKTFSVDPPRVPRTDFSFKLLMAFEAAEPTVPEAISSRLCFFFLEGKTVDF